MTISGIEKIRKTLRYVNLFSFVSALHISGKVFANKAWVKVFRINPEFRILSLTFHRKSASKC